MGQEKKSRGKENTLRQGKNNGARKKSWGKKKILGQGKKSWGKRKNLAASEKILGQEKNCFVTLSRGIFLVSEKNYVSETKRRHGKSGVDKGRGAQHLVLQAPWCKGCSAWRCGARRWRQALAETKRRPIRRHFST